MLEDTAATTSEYNKTLRTDLHLISVLNQGSFSLEASVDKLVQRGVAVEKDVVRKRLNYLMDCNEVKYNEVTGVYSRIRNKD